MQQFFLDELYISNVYGDSIPYRRSGQPKWIKCLYLGSKPQSYRNQLNRWSTKYVEMLRRSISLRLVSLKLVYINFFWGGAEASNYCPF